uniref:Family with sequence similarity 169 member B n=1 Tax=Sinocyclocheilus rhinocerous TaxID=307959 RepID=A0A673JNI2_9TELE
MPNVVFQVKPYPLDLPVRHYSELSKGYDEYLSSVKSGGAVPITLPHGEKVRTNTLAFNSELVILSQKLIPILLVVAVYLLGKWWPVGDVLKTSNKSRRGLALMVLSSQVQVISGILERPLGEDLYFSVYSMWEHGKILWQNGEAVGFYTVKKKGSLCDSCTGQSYQLPVTGLALRMLADFCSSQPSEAILGISFPMSPGMYGVCKKFLKIHEEERDRLYEVEAPGGWAQRHNVWLNIQLRDFPKHCKKLC